MKATILIPLLFSVILSSLGLANAIPCAPDNCPSMSHSCNPEPGSLGFMPYGRVCVEYEQNFKEKTCVQVLENADILKLCQERWKHTYEQKATKMKC